MSDDNLIQAERDALTGAVARREEIRLAVNKLNAEERELREWIDKLQLANRPQYPTDKQREGIVEAVRRIKANVRPESHLGDVTVDDYSVHAGVLHGRGWLTVAHNAATGTGTGVPLWGFTEDEQQALLDVIRGAGVEVLAWWPTAQGISVKTTHAYIAQPAHPSTASSEEN